MIGTITFQQKHKLWPSSCPPRAVNLLWHEPFQGATVTRPQTPTKPHRLLNNTAAAVFVHLLKVELSTCKGDPGQCQSLDQRQSSLIPAGAPATVRQRPSSSSGAQGQGNQGETTASARRHCLMGTATSCLPQELLHSCLPRSHWLGNYSDFHFRL